MSTPDQDQWLVAVAWRLDRLRWVPDDVLTGVVINQGECFWEYAFGDPPVPSDWDPMDRELAARLCVRCPVKDECLELELRTAGEQTVGVWGGLSENDRRALYRHWRQRGERATNETDGTQDAGFGDYPAVGQ